MDKTKYQAFVDDLNELVKKHGLIAYSTKTAIDLEVTPIGSDGDGVTIRMDDEESHYVLVE